METVRRRSVDPVYSMCVQPSFIIGTNNEDGQSGGNQSGNNDGSEEEYEWLMKQSEK